MFYEAMEEILPGVKIIINNDEGGSTQRTYLGDLEDTFDVELEEEEAIRITTIGEALEYMNTLFDE